MSTENIEIEKGNTGEIVITVTGVTDWTDILAKFYATLSFGNDPVMTLTGTIDSEANTVTFPYVGSDTSSLDAVSYYYEAVIYKEDKSYIKTTNDGQLKINPAIKVDPTT